MKIGRTSLASGLRSRCEKSAYDCGRMATHGTAVPMCPDRDPQAGTLRPLPSNHGRPLGPWQVRGGAEQLEAHPPERSAMIRSG